MNRLDFALRVLTKVKTLRSGRTAAVAALSLPMTMCAMIGLSRHSDVCLSRRLACDERG